MSGKQLFEIARKARELSYAPYSSFRVGAALLCADGKIYTGCNVENASYSATCCAERVALFKALSEGNTKFSAIAIIGGKTDGELVTCYPCGVCRQVLSEFCAPDFKIFVGDGKTLREFKLDELLPYSFEL